MQLLQKVKMLTDVPAGKTMPEGENVLNLKIRVNVTYFVLCLL